MGAAKTYREGPMALTRIGSVFFVFLLLLTPAQAQPDDELTGERATEFEAVDPPPPPPPPHDDVVGPPADVILESDVLRPGGVLVGLTPLRDGAYLPDAFGASITGYLDTRRGIRMRDWLIVGAPRERQSRPDGTLEQDGAVYFYARGDDGKFWLVRATTPQVTAGPVRRFGSGVVAANGWLFVASAGSNTTLPFAGMVDVYRLAPQTNSWVHIQTLTPPIPVTDGAFGARTQSRHMDISGRVLMIAEPRINQSGISRLHVYGLSNGTWQLRQSIDVGQDDAQNSYTVGDSVVALPGGRFVVSMLRESPADAPTEMEGSLLVYGRSGNSSAPINPTPIQTIAGDPSSDPACLAAGDTIGGMAASRALANELFRVARFAVAHICANGVAGQRVGRVDVYTVSNSAVTPLVPETSIEGTIVDGMLGQSLFSGQEAIAMDRDGRQMLIASTVGQLGQNMPGVDVLWYERGPTGWRVRNRLVSNVGPTPFRAFGHAVTFAQTESGFPDTTEAVVAQFSNGVDPSAPTKGAVLLYGWRYPSSGFSTSIVAPQPQETERGDN